MTRLAFLGTPEFAAVSLRALCENGMTPVVVYTQPPRPAGRGQELQKSAVQLYAESKNIPVLHPASLKSAEAQEEFRRHNLDIAVVAAYGMLLPKAILDAPKMGCVNVHGSILPRWRGAAPIQRAIMAGDAETGICLMQMDEGLDTGAVFTMEKISIGQKNAGEVHDALAALGGKMLARDLPGILAGKLRAEPQPADGVTYAAKIKKEEAQINWQKPAIEIERQIRAFAPVPGAWFDYKGERIKILAGEIVSGFAVPGTVTSDFYIAAADGLIAPHILQRPGKKPMSREEFLRGMHHRLSS